MEKILIGNRLKKLREKQGVTLSDLAQESGIQIATLSRIENNKMTGTIQCHAKIAYALGVELVELYKGIQAKDSRRKPISVEIKKNNDKGSIFSHHDSAITQTLIETLSDKKMLPELITIEGNGKTGRIKNKEDVERFAYVLAGEISVALETQTYVLTENESIYFNASSPHAFTNLTNAKAKVLSITTPSKL